jgi:ABC-type uncharacterized transport system substrate-binding protein
MNMDVQQINPKIKKQSFSARNYHHFIVVVVAAFSFLFFSPVTMAEKLIVIGDVNQPIHQQLINGLKKEFSQSPNSIVITHPSHIAESYSPATQADLIVSLGLAAARSTNNLTSDTPILYALLPRSLANRFTDCLIQICTQKRSALFLDQPVSRQLNLIKLIFPEIRQLSFLYGDFSAAAASELGELAKASGYTTHSSHVENRNELSRKLDRLLQESELFIALPDPLIHNRQTIPQLLLSTYRHNIPILGFSSSYVSAGAVAAVFSSTKELTQELITLIKAFQHSGQLPSRGSYPNQYRVEVNLDVARSMNLHIPSPNLLHKELLTLEKGL